MKTTHPVIVMKFGGAALTDTNNIGTTTKIIKKYYQNNNLIIIVSALKGVTNSLHDVALLTEKGDKKKALQIIDQLLTHHLNILYYFCKQPLEVFETTLQIQLLCDLLKLYIKKNNGKPLTLAQVDYIASFGERMAIHVVTKAVKNKQLKAIPIDTAYLLKTTRNFGNAKVLPAKSKKTVFQLLNSCQTQGIIPIITGYIGCTKDGCVTTFGRGGSDYSASLIASIMQVNKIILWKDVIGLYDKDPKIHKRAKLMKETNYKTAITLSKKGAKILHHASIYPAQSKYIPIWIKCFLDLKAKGTLIWKGETVYA